MLFTEPLFLFLFLPVLLTIYFIAPRGLRNPLLLAGSLLFYAWGERKFVIVLLVSLLFNYVIGRFIGGTEQINRRRSAVRLGIAFNLLLLGFFKYQTFIVLNLNRVLRIFQAPAMPLPFPHIPLGISFFTLIALAYIIDVYRKTISPAHAFEKFSLYMTFFPYLIAGPLVRYATVSKDMDERRFRMDEFAGGIRRFIIGMGKKMLIANTLAITVDGVFKVDPSSLGTSAAWLAAIAYPLQLYFDISGYADMAIGLALMFGFHLPENFNYPYVAESMTDFWRRWHMTLVAWFRDYPFFPLSYRRATWRIHLNLIVVFLLCGLWHEGSWKFMVWGGAHGTILAFERMGLAARLVKAPRVVRHLYVVLMIVITCVFVRATSLPGAIRFLGSMIGIHNSAVNTLDIFINRTLVLTLIIAVAGSMPLIPWLRNRHESWASSLSGWGRSLFDGSVGVVRLASLGAIFLASSALSATGTYVPFIYFQF